MASDSERPDTGTAKFDTGRPDAGPVDTDAGPVDSDAGPATPDAGPATPDAGPATPDAAIPELDAALPDPDAAIPEPDAAIPELDAALPELDAALPDPDAALPDPDATLPDPDAALPDPDAAPPELDAAPPEPDAEIPCAHRDTRACDNGCAGAIETCIVGEWGVCISPRERCNGRDDDCDGETDENFANQLGRDCTVGLGACRVRGVMECADNGRAACNAVAGPTRPEACNREDDDCDGETDEAEGGGALAVECYTGPADTENIGRCRPGGFVCARGQLGAVCEGESIPQPEVCNGEDDDCDGQIDEGLDGGRLRVPCFDGPAEQAGVGSCQRGTQICEAGALGACEGQGVPVAEVCSGFDDDCDGAVDEVPGCACEANAVEGCYSGPLDTRNVGSCRDGQHTCDAQGDAWSACDAQQLPTVEVCDGIDNDCNGVVDDLPEIGAVCSDGIGQCRQQGVFVCDLALQRLGCSAEALVPQLEICDGQDSDCDGVVDNLPQIGSPCESGLGQCARAGLWRCTDRDPQPLCDAAAGQPRAEACNGEDTDCNGLIDDVDGAGVICTVGRGSCARDGLMACDAGALECNVDPGAAQPEICDGGDTDCDGVTDNVEGVDVPCFEGIGECRRPGVTACNLDVGRLSCAAVATPPADEICDGRDNDCDGITDNVARLDAPCTVGQGACANTGQLRCGAADLECDVSALPVQPEACDGRDLDCDGQIGCDDADCVGHPRCIACSGAVYPRLAIDPVSGFNLICELDQLVALSQDPAGWSRDYALTTALDLSGAAGLAPIGNVATGFSGTFDGQGFALVGLSDGAAGARFGLFGRLEGTVRNLRLHDWNITGTESVGFLVGEAAPGARITGVHIVNGRLAGNNAVGGLIGANFGASIDTSSVQGTITGVAPATNIGGLVGRSTERTFDLVDCQFEGEVLGLTAVGGLVGLHQGGVVRRCSATVNLTIGAGGRDIGGLVGHAVAGTFEDVSTAGLIDAPGGQNVGGLVGVIEGANTIDGSASTMSIVAATDVGGLVGRTMNALEMTNCAYDGDLLGGSSGVGGLIGTALVGGTISNSPTTGTLVANGAPTAEGHRNLGGLAGRLDSVQVTDSDTSMSIQLVWGRDVGGLVGWQQGGSLENSHATGRVEALNAAADVSTFIGGLVGESSGAVRRCSAAGDVTAAGATGVGGLMGLAQSGAVIEDSAALGSLVVGADFVGGLVGQSLEGTVIRRVSASPDARGGDYVGGLIGWQKSALSACSATGDATGAQYVGGLVGYSHVGGTISRCTAAGDARGTLDVAGFCGYIWQGSISDSYATGAVTGDGQCGGFVGTSNDGDIRRAYATGGVNCAGEWVGGFLALVGGADAVVVGSFSTGRVPDSGAVRRGGFAGKAHDGYANCAWDVSRSGASGALAGAPLPGVSARNTPAIPAPGFFFDASNAPLDSWNFDTVWLPGAGFPTLRD